MAVSRNVYKHKPRNTGSRKRKPIIFMIAEGKNRTETHYFKSFGHDFNRNIRFANGNYTDPENMVQCLSNFLDENDFSPELGDKAFCLIDSDISNKKDAQIEKAVKLAEKIGMKVIVSAPCFEYWFLCHFTMTGKKYSSNVALLSDLEKYIPGYHKNSPDLYEVLKNKTSEAIKNAKIIEKLHLDDGEKLHTVSFSPSSEVYHVAEELSNISSES